MPGTVEWGQGVGYTGHAPDCESLEPGRNMPRLCTCSRLGSGREVVYADGLLEENCYLANALAEQVALTLEAEAALAALREFVLARWMVAFAEMDR